MTDLDDFTGANDITSVREVALDNGNTLYVKRTDPFGFFVFSLARGQIPEWMRGQYTSLDEAQKAIKVYLEQRKQAVDDLPELASAASNPTPKKTVKA